ncbi:hypothetical protein MM440_15765 [Arsenicicoccus piscis]|uniref:Uncharacterized protein n=1 Tax=Arsenicicoccus piscis TaxID=673954 RepID=A0ABQ6HPZ7_9MICO|nr:hypothetical protein [Arsenicicoccus piscis]MCH8629190.1 hypothetical protein [Arsenicicoccus piscis]GMA20240.1 hypothetical protein GCM10025862_22610 [Arsenicicoccus piscis]
MPWGSHLRADRYSPWTYWIAVLLVSVFGTVAADVVHVALGVPYEVSTPFFAVVLAVVLITWRRVEGTLSIHSVRTTRRELFYWATVLTTFALGTAAGDLSAKDTNLGYLGSGLMFAAMFAVPAVLWLATRRHEVALFWWAYVLTRPFGASFADWMGVPAERGGLGWGTGWVTLALLVLIAVTVAHLARTHRDQPLPATD